MQFGISPLETHKRRLKMSPSRSKDPSAATDLQTSAASNKETTLGVEYVPHDPLLLLPHFTGSEWFFEPLDVSRSASFSMYW
jgi:hypothetical protein